MFDVVWTDPQRESVGERRARKELEKKKKKTTTTTTDTVRDSACTRSISTASSSDLPIEKVEKIERSFGGLFSSRTLRRVTTSSNKNAPTSPNLQPPRTSVDSKRRSSLFAIESSSSSGKLNSKPGSIISRNSLQISVDSSESGEKTTRSDSGAHLHPSAKRESTSTIDNISDSGSGLPSLRNIRIRPRQRLELQGLSHEPLPTDGGIGDYIDLDIPTSPTSRDSVFSKATAQTAYTQSTACDTLSGSLCRSNSRRNSKGSSFIHHVSSSSFTTIGSKILTPRRQSDAYTPIAKPPVLKTFSDSSANNPPPTPPETPQYGHVYASLQPALYIEKSQDQNLQHSTSDIRDYPVDFHDQYREKTATTPTGWIKAFGPNDINAWNECDLSKVDEDEDVAFPVKVNVEELLADEDTLPCQPPTRQPTLSERFDAIQMSTEIMKLTDARNIVAALNRGWGAEKDPLVYKEMEMEKRRWMLSAIYSIQEEGAEKSSAADSSMSPSQVNRIMCLFETPGTLSYISAANPGKQIFNVANTATRLPDVYSNVIPVQVPAISPAHIPYAEGAFGAVYSYTMISSIAASEIPTALSRIHDCLAPGGVLHLAIIDPMPALQSAGPLLTQWIENNLIRGLARQFRCTNPSEMCYQWLANAGLGGAGSTISTASFSAVLPSERKKMHHMSSTTTSSSVDRTKLSDFEAHIELRCLVGRLLWKQVWGRHVGAHKWWWEDAAIVQECLEKETVWSYHLIEAVR